MQIMREAVSSHNLILTSRNQLQLLFQLSVHYSGLRYAKSLGGCGF